MPEIVYSKKEIDQIVLTIDQTIQALESKIPSPMPQEVKNAIQIIVDYILAQG